MRPCEHHQPCLHAHENLYVHYQVHLKLFSEILLEWCIYFLAPSCLTCGVFTFRTLYWCLFTINRFCILITHLFIRILFIWLYIFQNQLFFLMRCNKNYIMNSILCFLSFLLYSRTIILSTIVFIHIQIVPWKPHPAVSTQLQPVTVLLQF